jgi:hypothetical protein
MWGAIVGLVGLLVVYIARIVGKPGAPISEEPLVAPTHVRDLDIRPETFPPDIGAAARALWDAGDVRVALALLYRGMLSRLIHTHRVPIRDSSTELECLALAANHLTPRSSEFVAELIRVWQRFVYGGENVQAATVYMLCDDFGPALGRASSLGSGAGGNAE